MPPSFILYSSSENLPAAAKPRATTAAAAIRTIQGVSCMETPSYGSVRALSAKMDENDGISCRY